MSTKNSSTTESNAITSNGSTSSSTLTTQNKDANQSSISSMLSTTEDQIQQQMNDEVFSVFLQTLTGTILKLQVSKADTNIEIKQLLSESIETCYITSYALTIGDKVLQDFADISEYEEVKPGATISMKPERYDDKGARMHVYRLREILDSKLDDMYLSTGLVEKYSKKNVGSYPSFSHMVSNEPYNDLAGALDCDLEFQNIKSLNKNSKKKKKKKKSANNESNTTNSTTTTEQKKTKNENSDSLLEMIDVSKDYCPLPEELDSKVLFSAEKEISLAPLAEIIKHSSASVPKCVKNITFSAYNPPPGNRKLSGDLFYLEIETLEDKKIHVTSTPTGFYINGTKDKFDPKPAKNSQFSHTLLGLIWNFSPNFRKNFPNLLNMRTRKHPFEVTPVPFHVSNWVGIEEPHEYDANRAEETLFTVIGDDPRIQTREWNEEYQCCKELPSGTMEERIIRDRTQFKVHCDFVDASTKGAKAVVDKCLLPINPVDPEPGRVYIQNNIFYSFAVDTKEEGKEKKFEFDHAAYAYSSNDLKGVIAFNNADIRGIHTLASSIIDYRGYRVIAQSIIPGILQGDQGSKHVYGSIDDGSTFVWNEKYHELMKKAADKLHIKEHKVFDKEGKEFKIACPVECKSIVGSDGRFYVLDLVRTTPRDANYRKLETAILRPELVQSFARYKINKNKLESKNENVKKESKKEDKKEDEEEDDKKKTELDNDEFNPNEIDEMNLSESEQEKLKFKYNPNSFTEHKLADTKEQIKADEEPIIEISNFLVDEIIPSFLQEVKDLENIPLDGIELSESMHNRGINIRYLGRIAKLAEKEGIGYFARIVEMEMITRAAKIEFSSLIRKTLDENIAEFIKMFLNAMFGTDNAKKTKNTILKDIEGIPKFDSTSLMQNLVQLVKEKYDYELPIETIQKLPKLSALRSLCLKVGLKINCRDYDFKSDAPFTTADILGLEPIAKHSVPKSTTASGLLLVGKRQLSMNQAESAFEFLSQAIVMFQQVKGPMNEEVSACFRNIASILYQYNDVLQAILHQHKALLISKRVAHTDSAAVCQIYQILGILCHSISRPDFGLKHFLRAIYICKLTCGFDHPDLSMINANISMMYQDLGDYVRSIHYLKESLRINETILGKDHLQTAATYHGMAIAYSLIKQYKEALDCEKKTYDILLKQVGKNDSRIKECTTWLEHFTQKAVLAKRSQVMEEQQVFQSFMKSTQPLLGFNDKSKNGAPQPFSVPKNLHIAPEGIIKYLENIQNQQKLQTESQSTNVTDDKNNTKKSTKKSKKNK